MGMGFVMIKWKIELLTVLCICFSSTTVDGIKLTVSPSNDVEVNQTVTLRCELDPNPKPPIIVFFVINSTVLCTLEPRNGNCFDTLTKCETPYNASCSNETLYSIQVTVPWNWSGVAVDCKTFYNRSNLVVFTVKVPVTSVTLVPTPINVTVGQQIYITCTTSYCYPPANITWNRSSTNIANQFEFTSNDLVRTSSIFSINASKSDNGKQVYCTASNISGKRVNSTVNMVTVLYKPEVTPGVLSPYRVIEGQTTALECAVIAANPNTSIIWEWSKTDRPITVLSDGPYLILPKIHRNMSGPYNCTASNSVGTSEAGIISVDVLYKPEVIPINLSPHSVIEGQTAALECAVIDANPNTSIIWRWSRTDRPYAVLSEGPNYTIPNIHRNMSGPYNCTASNSVGTSKAGLITVDVLYEPEVIPGILSPYRVIEGQTTALECEVIDANPKTSIIWRWYGTDRSNSVFYYGPNFTIPNIHRNMSGRYNCTASNSVGTSKAGIITVDVLYKPKIADTTSTTVNEGDRVILEKEIVSNPLSNVSWYNGSKLLDYQVSVAAATLTIEKATCTDTKNFTLIASNTVEKSVSALVELFVNCKPRSYRGTITLGVTDTSGIDFSTTVIAYPEPFYELRYENGTTSNKMMGSITRNAVNNFTIRLNQTSVEQADFGTYRLLVSNPFGETVVVLNVIPQRKPTMPERVEIVCEVTRARVQWRSSFNGGDPQSFTVIALNGQQRESRSDNISDKGENAIHSTFVQNLQPSTTYVFYVIAQNSHGLSSSENVSCTTLEEDSNDLPFITGGAAAGGITLAIVLVVVVVVLLRLKKRQNKERNSDKNNPMRTNEDASHYTTLAEQDVTVERNVYEILTQKEGANQYEACLMKESQETNSQMYESLQKKEISDKRNISDKHMIAKYTKDLSNIYANQSAAENSSEYINLSFSK